MTISSENRPYAWPLWISLSLGLAVAILHAVRLIMPVGRDDLWWHIALGRWFFESGALIVDHAAFTWTPAISYFPYNTWLGDILLFVTDEFGGLGGLTALLYLALFIPVLLGWHYAWIRGVARHPLTWAILLLSLTFLWPGAVLKPQVFSMTLFSVVVWLYFLLRYRGESRWPLAYLLPLLMVLWVNVHGGFFISALFFLAILIGEFLNSRFSPALALPPRLRWHLLMASLLCLPALAITPYGLDYPIQIVSDVFSGAGHASDIIEYKPSYIFNAPPFYILDYMILAMLVFVFLLWQRIKNHRIDWVVILAFLGYSAIFTQLVRVTFYLGPIFLFVALDLLAARENSSAWPKTPRARSLLALAAAAILTLTGWRLGQSINFPMISSYEKIKSVWTRSAYLPSAEADYLLSLPGQKVGNLYDAGSYLLYRLWPQKRLMIDPRYFPFRAWISDYFRFEGGEDFDSFTARYVPDYWFIGYTRIDMVMKFQRSADWRVAFLGPAGAVFVPKAEAPAEPVIAPRVLVMEDVEQIIRALSVALELDNYDFADRLQEAARRGLSKEYPAVVRSIEDAIAGFKAYADGRYEAAAALLESPKEYFETSNKATDVLMILAARAWENKDYAAARDYYRRLLKIQAQPNVGDLYNFSVIDWQVRQAGLPVQDPPKEEMRWETLAGIILKGKQGLSKELQFMVDTAQAMQDGSYQGGAELIDRSLTVVRPH